MPKCCDLGTLVVNSATSSAIKLASVLISAPNSVRYYAALVLSPFSVSYSIYTRYVKLKLNEQKPFIQHCKHPLFLCDNSAVVKQVELQESAASDMPLLPRTQASTGCLMKSYHAYEHVAKLYPAIVFAASYASCLHLYAQSEWINRHVLALPIDFNLHSEKVAGPLLLKLTWLLVCCAGPGICAAIQLFHYRLHSIGLNSDKLFNYLGNSKKNKATRAFVLLVLSLNTLGYAVLNGFYGDNLVPRVVTETTAVFSPARDKAMAGFLNRTALSVSLSHNPNANYTNQTASGNTLNSISEAAGVLAVLVGLPMSLSNSYKLVKLLDKAKFASLWQGIKSRNGGVLLLIFVLCLCAQMLTGFSYAGMAETLSILPMPLVYLCITSQLVCGIMYDMDIHFSNVAKVTNRLNIKASQLWGRQVDSITLSPHFSHVFCAGLFEPKASHLGDQCQSSYKMNSTAFIERLNQLELISYFDDIEMKNDLSSDEFKQHHGDHNYTVKIDSNYFFAVRKGAIVAQSAAPALADDDILNSARLFRYHQGRESELSISSICSDQGQWQHNLNTIMLQANRSEIYADGLAVCVKLDSLESLQDRSNPNSPHHSL